MGDGVVVLGLDTDKRVEHPFPPCFLELDLQLITLDPRDFAVAEFAVEDALAGAEVVAALIAKALVPELSKYFMPVGYNGGTGGNNLP